MTLLKSMKDWLTGRQAVKGIQGLVGRPEATSEPSVMNAFPAPEVTHSPQPANHHGVLLELSSIHAKGWVWDPSSPQRRVGYRILLSGTDEVLASGDADQFEHGLSAAGVGDGAHSFWTRLARPISEAERRLVSVICDSGQPLARSPHIIDAYEPVLHVAMDIVDNCNLRCPFCLYDYEHTHKTNLMTTETLEAALKYLPYVKDGEFWFSCLHEPALHPRLVEFIEKVPQEYRRKLFFTTNLAKRMSRDYFEWLVNNRMHHINISIESRDPAIYERMRKGARHRIFQENWDVLMGCLERAEIPTRIRYIMMAYKSNLREIPELTRYLLEERHAWQVEIRYTFDVAHLPKEFRAAEFLDEADWDWLADELARYSSAQVQLLRPPTPGPVNAAADLETPTASIVSAPPDVSKATIDPASVSLLPGRALFRLSWDGSLKVVGVLSSSRYDSPIEETMLETNIREPLSPEALLERLPMHS